MRAVLQRVSHASVAVGDEITGAIGPGLLVFLGVSREDTPEDARWLIQRIATVRIFDDGEGRMNRSLMDTGGEALVISQFTVYGSLRKGNRPSFNRAAPPEQAIPAYEQFVAGLAEALGKPVPTGRFGACMRIDACNDGPVTLVIDSREREF